MPEEHEPWNEPEEEDGMAGFQIPIPPELARVLKLNRKKDEMLESITEKRSEIAENEILMTLWRDLGDQTETYHQAMSAIAVFIKVSDKIKHAGMEKRLPPPVAMRIMQAWSQVALHGVETMREMMAAMDEANAAAQAEQ